MISLETESHRVPSVVRKTKYEKIDSDSLEESSDEVDKDAEATMKKLCPYCEKNVFAIETLEYSPWSFAIPILSLCFCGWISLCIIPFLWSILKYVVYKCPFCENTIETKSRIVCFRFKEKIVTLRIGSCAIVLSKTYVISLFILSLLICTALSIRWYINMFGFPDIKPEERINATWNDFLLDCSTRSYLGNPVRAESMFTEKYSYKTILWTGRMHHIHKGFFSKYFIYIDMDPPYYHREDLRDLVLVFNKSLKLKASTVNVGDELRFEATLLDFGKRGRPHIGLLWDFNITHKLEELGPYSREVDTPLLIIRKQLAPPIIFPRISEILLDLRKKMDESTNEETEVNFAMPISISFQKFDIEENEATRNQ